MSSLHNHFKRFIFQSYDGSKSPPDFEAVRLELLSRGVDQGKVHLLTDDHFLKMSGKKTIDNADEENSLSPSDFIVGDFSWTRHAFKQYGIKMPDAPDYPSCLRHLLHRKIWKSTLGEVKKELSGGGSQQISPGTDVYIKPEVDAKAFAAICEPSDMMIDFVLAQFGENFPVLVSEKVEMLVEYRVYVAEGSVRACCKYLQKESSEEMVDFNEKALQLDLEVVREAIALLAESEDHSTRGLVEGGCAIDFAVVKKDSEIVTALLEVNDGWSLGKYQGLSDKDYTDLLLSRWKRATNGSSCV